MWRFHLGLLNEILVTDYHETYGSVVSLQPANRSPVAQLVEQAAVNRLVVGSSPTGGALNIPLNTV